MSDQLFIYKKYNDSKFQKFRNSGIHVVLDKKLENQKVHTLNLVSGCLYLGSSYIHYHLKSDLISPESNDIVLIENPTEQQKNVCKEKGCILIDVNGVEYIECDLHYAFGSKRVTGFKLIKVVKSNGQTENPPPVVQSPPVVQPPPVVEAQPVVQPPEGGASDALGNVQEPDKSNT